MDQIIVKHVTLSILAVLIVAGNSTLIFVTLRKKSLRTITNFLVVTLGVSDLLMGSLVLPLLVSAEEGLLGNSPLTCLRIFCLAIAEVLVSCLVLMAIAVERYIAIRCPLRHHAMLTPRNAMFLIAFCWIYAICVGCLPLFGWNALGHNSTQNATGNDDFKCRYQNVIAGSYAAFMYPGHFIPLWIILITLYCLIYMRTRQQAPRGSIVRRLSMQFLQKHPTRRLRENWRAMRILTVIVGYFLFSWLGLVVWYVALYRGFTLEYAVNIEPPLPFWFYNTAVTLAFGNSAINPFIYGLGNRSVRRAFCEMIRLGSQRKRNGASIVCSRHRTFSSEKRLSPCSSIPLKDERYLAKSTPAIPKEHSLPVRSISLPASM